MILSYDSFQEINDWLGYPNIQIPIYRYLPHLSVRRKNPTSTFILCLSRYQMLDPEMPYSKRVLLNCKILDLVQFIPSIVFVKRCSFISFKSYAIISNIMFHSPYCLYAHLKSDVLLSLRCYLLNEEMNRKVNKWQAVQNR